MRRSMVFALVIAGAALAPARQIEIPDWENAVRFVLVASQDPVRPGDEIELALLADIQEGYHLYGPEEPEPSRTKVSLVGDALKGGDPVYPPVTRRDLAGLGEFDLYEGSIAIRIPVTMSGSSGAQALEAAVEVAYQICTDFACSAPETDVFTIALQEAKPGAAVKKLRPDVFQKK